MNIRRNATRQHKDILGRVAFASSRSHDGFRNEEFIPRDRAVKIAQRGLVAGDAYLSEDGLVLNVSGGGSSCTVTLAATPFDAERVEAEAKAAHEAKVAAKRAELLAKLKAEGAQAEAEAATARQHRAAADLHKAPLRSIEIGDDDGGILTFSTWDGAREHLLALRSNCATSGYAKIDFTVTWANGEDQGGRYDLDLRSSCDLALEVSQQWSFYAGRNLSPELAERRASMGRQGDGQLLSSAGEAETALDTLSLSDCTVGPVFGIVDDPGAEWTGDASPWFQEGFLKKEPVQFTVTDCNAQPNRETVEAFMEREGLDWPEGPLPRWDLDPPEAASKGRTHRAEVVDDTEAAPLVPQDDIEQIVAHRDAAVELYTEALADLEAALVKMHGADALVSKAVGAHTGGWRPGSDAAELASFNDLMDKHDFAQLLRTATRLADHRIWDSVVTRTELEKYMDATAKGEFRSQLAYIPEQGSRGNLINAAEIAKGAPPISVEAIETMLEGFRAQASEIWKRGVATAFSKLDSRFKSHDGFGVGKGSGKGRVILTRVFDDSGNWSWSYRSRRDVLSDVERAFYILDGKQPPLEYAGIVGQIDTERKAARKERRGYSAFESFHEDGYFRVRIFQNGNVHLYFNRPDLLKKVNQLLAEYYGAGLGWGKADQEDPEAPLKGDVAARGHAKNFGLFETPDELADRVVEAARLYTHEGDLPLLVLEPSAGTGQLSRRAASPPYTAVNPRVDVVEVQPHLAAALRAERIYRVFETNFLELEPQAVYDRIIMNPPFDRLRDVDHVNHALGFLAPGGKLVAIMSASARYSTTKKAQAFQAKVKKMKGSFTDLPEGSFRSQGANVNTVLLEVSVSLDEKR